MKVGDSSEVLYFIAIKLRVAAVVHGYGTHKKQLSKNELKAAMKVGRIKLYLEQEAS